MRDYDNWDNEDTWASQLFIGHNTANIQHRIQGANGDWSFWQDFSLFLPINILTTPISCNIIILQSFTFHAQK